MNKSEVDHGDGSGAAGSAASAASPGYPEELVSDVVTGLGTTLRLRPIRPDDAALLVDFHRHLSLRSVYRRYLYVHRILSSAEVERFTRVDYVDRLALVVEDDQGLVAVARYDRTPGTSEAEVAFVVADQYQHHGIGTVLLEHLAAAAWRRGITTFVATTLMENREMLDVFANSGFAVTTAFEDGTVSVRFPIAPNDVHRSTHRSQSKPGPAVGGGGTKAAGNGAAPDQEGAGLAPTNEDRR